jgi:competence protein ComEC
MKQNPIYTWKRAPFIRMMAPLLAGIVFQRILNIYIEITWTCILLSSACLCFFSYLKLRTKFKWYWTSGIFIQVIFFSLGALLLHYRDISNSGFFIGKHYTDKAVLLLQIEEPLSEKPNSFKAVASLHWMANGFTSQKVKGNVIIYFKKNKFIRQQVAYGSRIIVLKGLERIRNSGNPGAFDYETYCHFQDIYYQVYVDSTSFTLLKENHGNLFNKILYKGREKVVDIIRENIKGDKEAGLAEALLIGYKDDLDKSLVQAYSNMGVVHIVAISGLHLGLIYWLLGLMLKPLEKKKSLRWLQLLLFISGLWLFSLLAGAGPSVVRSAVMFTFIIIGKGFSKKAIALNSLAASAFLLLCYNPYWIWDIGFQLSYLAVWSLIVFMQPIYRLVFLQNKILDVVWQMNAVTISAQILTVPVSIYYFHQFPNLFLLTNMIAVPLSSIIVVGEIFLCCGSFFPYLPLHIGAILKYLILLMNGFVLSMDRLPFALWTGILINFSQVLLLYTAIAFFTGFIAYRNKKHFVSFLLTLLIFACISFWSNWNAKQQCIIIVYNAGRFTAIDFVEGKRTFFVVDSELIDNKNMIDYQVNPSRSLFRIQQIENIEKSSGKNEFVFGNQEIFMADGRAISNAGTFLDLLILASNKPLNPDDFLKHHICKRVIADASISVRNTASWREACIKRKILFHSVRESGAFLLRIN